jgi:hypothetical protein
MFEWARTVHALDRAATVIGATLIIIIIIINIIFIMGVGIATGYGLDGRVVGVRVPVGSRIF